MRRSTLADVARDAGVSKTTASMALNGKGANKIPDSTRIRVQAAADALRFRPHGVARALTRRRADVLGIVCTVSPFVELAHHAFEHTLLAAIFHHALERGFNPMIYSVPSSGELNDTRTCSAYMHYADGRSDAFIMLYPPPDSSLVQALHTLDIPVVALCCRCPGEDWRWVDSDNAAGIRSAVDHLVALGHRRIAYLIGPSQEDNVNSRVMAYRTSLAEHGLTANESWIVPYTWNTLSTQDQIDRFFALPEPPTALLTWNDYAAEEVYRAVLRRGLRIPEDVSIVGFDDMPASHLASPPLTTVRQDVVRMGRAAVDLAIEAIEARVPPCANPMEDEAGSEETLRSSIVCPVEFVVRQSTAPPPAFGAG